MAPRRPVSAEALGLTVYSHHSPEKRATIKVERLKTIPMGDFIWKETRDEFNSYLRLFDKSTGKLCRCGHKRTDGGAWVHLPDPMRGERACQPDGMLCDCKGWSPVHNLATQVVKDAKYVRSAANSAWRGTRLPRYAPLEKRMGRVYRFIQRRA